MITPLPALAETAGATTGSKFPVVFGDKALTKKLGLDADPRNGPCLVTYKGIVKIFFFIGSPGSCLFGPSALKYGSSAMYADQMDVVFTMVSRIPRPSSTSHLSN